MLRSVKPTMNAPSVMIIQDVTWASSLNRHDFWPLPLHPHRNDQPRDRKRGEHRGDDADAEGHRKATNRTGADPEQDRGGNKGGDVGVENGCKRPGETGIDSGDGTPPRAEFLADALVDQHVG